MAEESEYYSESVVPLQLIRLARKFPEQLISQIKKGTHTEDYVNHSVISQRLLQICGAYDWDTEVIYSENVPVAIKGTLALEIDGQEVMVSGIGSDQGNQNKNIGDKLKEMESDALKRAASKVGCGLHLWAQNQYFLYTQLKEEFEVSDEDVR